MDYYFKEVTVGQIEALALEADQNKAFLPQRYEPDFKVLPFLVEYKDISGFRAFALTEDGCELLSFIAILPSKDDRIMYIGPMYVGTQHQGKGLGKKQVEELIKWAKNKNYKSIHTKTWGGNIRSRKIFEGLGFSIFEELADQRVNGDSSIKYNMEL